MAALQGHSTKDYVLSRALVYVPHPATMTDAEALQALKEQLTPRLAEADAGRITAASAEDFKREARVRQSRK